MQAMRTMIILVIIATSTLNLDGFTDSIVNLVTIIRLTLHNDMGVEYLVHAARWASGGVGYLTHGARRVAGECRVLSARSKRRAGGRSGVLSARSARWASELCRVGVYI